MPCIKRAVVHASGRPAQVTRAVRPDLKLGSTKIVLGNHTHSQSNRRPHTPELSGEQPDAYGQQVSGDGPTVRRAENGRPSAKVGYVLANEAADPNRDVFNRRILSFEQAA